jgi:hypothetical protein
MRAAEEILPQAQNGYDRTRTHGGRALAVNLGQYLYKRELHPLSC